MAKLHQTLPLLIAIAALGASAQTSSTSRAPTQKRNPGRVALPKHLAKAKTSKTPSASRIVSLAYFAKAGSMYQNSVPAVVLSDRLLAVRMDKNGTLQEIASDYQFYLHNRKYTHVRPVDIDLRSRWVLMESEIPVNFATIAPTPHSETLFEEPTKAQMVSDIAQMRAQYENRRATASISPNSSDMLQSRILSEGDAWTSAFQHATARLKIDRLNLAPQVAHLRCHPDSPSVDSADLQESLSSAQGLKCESISKVKIYKGFEQGFKLSSGVLDFALHRESNETLRTRLLQELAMDEMNDLKKHGSQVEYSSPVICETSYITDSRVDAYYCTRTLRGFPALSDSVLIFGRLSGQKYVYNMVRTSGFSSQSTGSIVQTVLETMETNQ